ncbi:MAG: MmgE/PrpD family protein, partial [Actinomycetota bacterium]|nr:MmgE/PrpD family protein [Actinomycetota bacterium]
GMAAGMSSDAHPARLVEDLGERWAVLDTSFKFHASCRHTHPAADALLQALQENGLTADRISRVRTKVHQAAIDVLGPVTDPRTVHQAKFSMGFVLALIALRGAAGIDDFTEESIRDPELRAFHDRVEMVLDPEIDAAYPKRWIGLVEVETTDGRHLTSRVEVPKGDPGNPLSRTEIEDKARRLAAFRDGASTGEIGRIIERAWNLDREPDVRDFLGA